MPDPDQVSRNGHDGQPLNLPLHIFSFSMYLQTSTWTQVRMCLPTQPYTHAHSAYELNAINTYLCLNYRLEFWPTVVFRSTVQVPVSQFLSPCHFFHSSHDNFLTDKGEERNSLLILQSVKPYPHLKAKLGIRAKYP